MPSDRLLSVAVSAGGEARIAGIFHVKLALVIRGITINNTESV